jgi:hypothetical protein
MKLGETKVKEQERYTLYAIQKKDNYTIILSKDLNVWGSYLQRANDVARLKVPVTELQTIH